MSGTVEGGPAPRRWVRWLLWLHAFLWTLFALGMIVVAVISEEAREHSVFVQVLIASSLAAIGAVAAARYRVWGVLLTLLAGSGVVIAWFLGDSGDPYRYYVMIALALFAVLVAIDRRAFVRSAGQ